MSGRAPSRRTVIAHTRVSSAELAEWNAKAAAAGVTLSELLRQAMSRTQTWTAPAMEVERERTRQVARIGSNLNQIARWANTHLDGTWRRWRSSRTWWPSSASWCALERAGRGRC